MFNPSNIILWILLRLVGLTMLSACLSRVISKIRATYFTARMPVPLQFLGHEIVYFGILKYHSVHEKPRNGVLSLQWDSGDMWAPH